MAEPLKNQFGPDIPVKIAGMIQDVHSAFESDNFVAHALDGYEPLELKERGRKIAESLRAFLPDDYEHAIKILLSSQGPVASEIEGQGMAPFLYFPHVTFVHDYGLDHFDASMQAQYELTQRFTAEFSIRPFIERYQEKTLAQLRIWTQDPSHHVRRLVSEGTRPRLPWASRLREFQKNPSPVIDLLELLKDDESLYVRRSVANNLNDIGKDHPDVLVRVASEWMSGASKEREWLVRHALRSAVKRGDPSALAILGFGSDEGLFVSDVQIEPDVAQIGDKVTIEFSVVNGNTDAADVMVDFQVHYIKANGKPRPKVFKLKQVWLPAGGAIRVKKSVSLKEMTTRKHYPGIHAIDAILNGGIRPLGQFTLS